jgi:adenylate cyclase
MTKMMMTIYAIPRKCLKHFFAFAASINETPEILISKFVLSLLVFAESMVCVFWIFTLSGLGEGYALMAAIPYVYIVFSYTSLLVFYRLKRFEYFTFTQLVMLLVMPFFMQWVIGGFEASSGMAIWALLSPVGALMMLSAEQSTPWFVLYVALAGVSWYLNSLFAGNALPIPSHVKNIFFVMNLAGLATVLYSVMRYFQSQKNRVLEALEVEKARSEKLLLSILPQSIASRLKDNNQNIADSHEAVTIMFTDIVNFTTLSANMPANELVSLLNQVFTKFDELAEKYGLEKIKTIGDAYMVVGGVPEPRADHAVAVAEMALEIPQALKEISTRLGIHLSMRIGIHSGSVIAGVIGNSKFSYDLWGDTVNLASRMESLGIPNEIQVSEASYLLLRDKFKFETRGALAVKGRGEVNAYLLKGKL